GFREGLEDDNRRVIQHAVVEIGSRPLHLFNAHFSWVAEQARDNIAESAALLPQDADAVLAGDLNTPPESALFQPFRDAGFVDAWAALHPGEDGYTFEADKPFTRIDYFWLSPGLAPQLREVERLNPGGDGIWLSDHIDRKSTRLNSSHVKISYAVFCLKKKNKNLLVLIFSKSILLVLVIYLIVNASQSTSILFPYTTLFRSSRRGRLHLRSRQTVHAHRLFLAEPGARPAAARGRAPQTRRRRDLAVRPHRSEEHTSELQSRENLVCRLLLEKKK